MTEEAATIEATDTQTDTATDTAVVEESGWNWNSDLPGSGDAPDWLNTAKYNDVSEQAKAYKELESRFGGFTGAPDEYSAALPEDLVLPEGVEFEFDDQDPIFQAIAPVAKELNMSQEGLNKMLGAYFGATAEQMQQEMISDADYVQKELASIPQGEQRASQMNAWAKSNLPEDQYEAFLNAATDTTSMLMLEALINKSRTAPLPTPTEANTKGYTKADIDDAMKELDQNGKNKYLTSESHRKKVMRMMEMQRD